MYQKKSIKIRIKILFNKKCPIEFKFSHFLDKIFGKNMSRFQLNPTTFYKIKFCLEKLLLKILILFFWYRPYFVKMANAAPIEVFDSFLEKYLVPIFPGFRNFPDFFFDQDPGRQGNLRITENQSYFSNVMKIFGDYFK